MATAIGDVLVDGVQVIGSNGSPVGLTQAPSFGWAWNPTDMSGISLQTGSAPARAGEVVLDTETAARAGLEVGVTVAEGTTPDQASERITKALGDPNLRVMTRAQVVSEAQQQINQSLNFLSTFLLVFAGIALLVGSFLVLNTFSVLVAQRSRDLAMLRALGATRRQVSYSVLGEALIVGLVGGTVGLALGLLLALGIQKGFATIGMDMPYAGLTVSWTAILASYAVAVVVTVLAAWLPARRASRIKPVAALLEASTAARRSLRGRTITGTVVLGLGVVTLVAAAVRTPSSLALVGIGAVLVLAGGVLVSPWLVSATLAGAAHGTRGHLAASNSAPGAVSALADDFGSPAALFDALRSWVSFAVHGWKGPTSP